MFVYSSVDRWEVVMCLVKKGRIWGDVGRDSCMNCKKI